MVCSIELMLIYVNYNVYCIDMGEEGIDFVKFYDYDLILLDLDLFDMYGMEVLCQICMLCVDMFILILIGLDDMESKLKGFGFGVDDYMIKFFNWDELVVCIQVIICRLKGYSQLVICIGEMVVNFDVCLVEVVGCMINLMGKEYQIFELFSLCKGMMLIKEMFLNYFYGGMDELELKIIDVFVCKLCKKLVVVFGGESYIEMVWGCGYVLCDLVIDGQIVECMVLCVQDVFVLMLFGYFVLNGIGDLFVCDWIRFCLVCY